MARVLGLKRVRCTGRHRGSSFSTPAASAPLLLSPPPSLQPSACTTTVGGALAYMAVAAHPTVVPLVYTYGLYSYGSYGLYSYGLWAWPLTPQLWH